MTWSAAFTDPGHAGHKLACEIRWPSRSSGSLVPEFVRHLVAHPGVRVVRRRCS